MDVLFELSFTNDCASRIWGSLILGVIFGLVGSGVLWGLAKKWPKVDTYVPGPLAVGVLVGVFGALAYYNASGAPLGMKTDWQYVEYTYCDGASNKMTRFELSEIEGIKYRKDVYKRLGGSQSSRIRVSHFFDLYVSGFDYPVSVPVGTIDYRVNLDVLRRISPIAVRKYERHKHDRK